MDETTQESTPATVIKARDNSLAIPISIVIGFGMVAVAIFLSGVFNPAPQNVVQNVAADPQEKIATTGPVRPIDESDHIRGNPNAEIMIIEYSDFDCPFCKNYHETMNRIMSEYGTTGKVGWVYRHFPLESRHPSAKHIAIASECVAKLGGNDAFWKFTDLVFGERGVNDPTNTTRLNEFAVSSGVSGNAFDACLESKETQPLVEEDMADGINAGASGTPYSLVLVGGQQGVINGAEPYQNVKGIIDTLITQLEGKDTETQQAQ